MGFVEKYDTFCILYNYKKNDIEFIEKYVTNLEEMFLKVLNVYNF